MPREESTRDQVQRRMFVALADSAPLARRRPGVLVALAVFALSGALAGAAVSAVAQTAEPPNVSRQVPTTAMLSTLVPGSTRLLGSPFTIENGDGSTAVDVGPAPDGATELFISFGCLDAGTHTTSIDGVVSNTFACDGPSLGSGGGRTVDGAGSHTLRVEGEGEYVLWASWSAPAVLPEASAEQSAALADGTVTEVEYRQGFASFQQCMTDAGYSVDVADAPGPLISYTTSTAADDSGAEEDCYAANFRLIDIAFQAAHKEVP